MVYAGTSWVEPIIAIRSQETQYIPYMLALVFPLLLWRRLYLTKV